MDDPNLMDDSHPAPAENQSSQKSQLICLDQLLKLTNVAATGGMAKQMIQDGEVLVNDEIETRRRRKLQPEDVVTVFDQVLIVGDFLTKE